MLKQQGKLETNVHLQKIILFECKPIFYVLIQRTSLQLNDTLIKNLKGIRIEIKKGQHFQSYFLGENIRHFYCYYFK